MKPRFSFYKNRFYHTEYRSSDSLQKPWVDATSISALFLVYSAQGG
jgi:hypothetical protein